MGEGKTPEAWDEWTAKMQAKHSNGNGHGKSLAIEAARLLPTPTTEPTTGNGHARHLAGEIKTLPTPTVGDSKSAANRTAGRSDPDSKHHDGLTLTDVVRLLPTPRASPNEDRQTKRTPSQRAGKHGLSLAAEIGELGASTSPPSTDTPESSDDLLHLLTTTRASSPSDSASG